MLHTPCRIVPFLAAVEGNWRNAIYIECKERDCPHAAQCGAVLFAAGADGAPLLISASDLSACGGIEVDKHECLGSLEKDAFVAAYRSFLNWRLESDGSCALRELLKTTPHPFCRDELKAK